MRSDPLATLEPFVTLLSACPEPDTVAEALALGPLLPLAPVGTHLYRRVDHPTEPTGELVSIGSRGVDDDVLARYARLDLSLDLPVTRAVVSSRIVVTPMQSLASDYAPLSVDADMWDGLAAQPFVDGGSIVCLPMLGRGRSIGAVTFLAPRIRTLGALEQRVVGVVGALLGLWLQACDGARTVTRHAHGRVGGGGGSLLKLTDRQHAVLELVAQGKGNAAIAATLGFGVSTVKQDITRMNRALRVHSRGELVERARELGLLAATDPPA